MKKLIMKKIDNGLATALFVSYVSVLFLVAAYIKVNNFSCRTFGELLEDIQI